MASTPPNRVLCVCTKCRQSSHQDQDGKLLPGVLVHPGTRRAHLKLDADMKLSMGVAGSGSTPHEAVPRPDHHGDVHLQLLPNEQQRATHTITAAAQATEDTDVFMEDINLKEESSDTDTVMADDGDEQASAIMTLALVLASWLHLCCGLSREASSRVLKVVHAIITLTFQLARLFHITSRADSDTSSMDIDMKHDVRTAMSNLSIEPILHRSVCCPKCFAQYSIQDCPDICPRRETRRSKPCGEVLWTIRHGSNGGPIRCPRRLYSTQSFESWLTWFLSRPGIEDIIDESYAHVPSGDTMHSIRDSPAWKSFGSFTSTRGNLVFSYYIDWFNPLTNKIAGKKVSAGAIMLFCMNLPEHLQWLPENTFFAGITPPPNEPTVTTITNIADPVIDQLAEFYTGKKIPTYRYPMGFFTRVGVMPFIADLIAIRKAGAGGFASHSAELFCSFCTCLRSQLECLDPTQWRPRTGLEVRTAAWRWHDAQTKTAKKEIFAETGVRWSSLHKLSYRDPVRHTVLGVMHNWMEGVLQHHARRKWGIGIEPGSSKDEDDSMLASASDINQEASDADAMDIDIIEHNDIPSSQRRRTPAVNFQMDSSGEESGDDDFLQADDESESDDSDDEDTKNDTGPGPTCIFSTLELGRIRACISDTVIPTWVDRPPVNLGDKSHGKLKADNWFILFSVMLPMVLVELWWSTNNHRDAQLLENFYDLVTCTNIIGSFSTSNDKADTYHAHYIRYRSSLRQLFPRSNSVPNHHYAMHNAELLKFWGPLMKISEFPYERSNGRLQKIKTNGHICEYVALDNYVR
ncbi:hypothetical protein GLOTRDRAFT_44744 [Gloeophyllum trabeum ATCC 11539]|uniref:Transposase domain-containing protein n=1 Tax=Gloeophyllum trabeum (strain ATCC 11539 / FP-39264 / Madison 617) TaxID=670483 RepID=S7RL87_GLOTA|nr:uncharacterized protein GLOTRDRAFT_44744 [Gloeophyllum trabeum ATCC 11539]EPQ53429.1 hypothetical protein GLOTRDRAFT_44744 [Gloeophyllum trabeum ATCC 11539]